MKFPASKSAAVSIAALLVTVSNAAFASNETVDSALRSHQELSSFYQGLANTGILEELDPDTTYTIFAPTNKAMAKISQQKYPCFYSQQCHDEVRDILRNHIVASPLQLGSGPDISAAYSLSEQQLNIGAVTASRNNENTNPTNFIIDGQRVLRAQAMGAGHLYDIDGVIATPQQKINVSQLKSVPTETEIVLVPVPTTTRVVDKKVYYAPDGSPDGVSQTTVTTRSAR